MGTRGGNSGGSVSADICLESALFRPVAFFGLLGVPHVHVLQDAEAVVNDADLSKVDEEGYHGVGDGEEQGGFAQGEGGGLEFGHSGEFPESCSPEVREEQACREWRDGVETVRSAKSFLQDLAPAGSSSCFALGLSNEGASSTCLPQCARERLRDEL